MLVDHDSLMRFMRAAFPSLRRGEGKRSSVSKLDT